MSKLTDKQKRFAEEYLKDLNATEAAIKAGYIEKTAAKAGSSLLCNKQVMEYIHELAQAMKKPGMGRENQIDRYNCIYDKALDDNAYGHALKALERIDRLMGLEAAQADNSNKQQITWQEERTYETDNEANTSA